LIREIGVHLAAKVFEEAVKQKSSMVAIFTILFNIFIIKSSSSSSSIINIHLFSVQHMNKEMYEHFQHGGMEQLKSYIRAKMWLPNYRPLVQEG